MENNELKPCPFCGGGAELVVREGTYGICGAWVRCKECDCKIKAMNIHELIITKVTISTPTTNDSRQRGIKKAITAWNRRANDGT